MNHLPYPVSTSVPPVEVPLLAFQLLGGTDVACCPLEHTEGCLSHGTIQEQESAHTNVKPVKDDACGPCQYSNALTLDTNSQVLVDWTSSFWRYPEKRGWSVTGNRSWWTSDPEETARRAQEWLYFHLLHMFLGAPIDCNILSRHDQNGEKKLLDSSVLPELLTQWMRRQSASEQNIHFCMNVSAGGARKESTVETLLALVALECNTLDDFPEPSRSTALAIRILAETLNSAIFNLMRVNTTESRTVQKIEENSLLRERFLSNGWCPYQAARLWGQYSASTTYYLSSLRREPTFGGVKHHQCDENRCMTTSIDPSTYEPQHAGSCSAEANDCRMLGVCSSTVADIISRGRIPLVKFVECVDGTLQPEIIESGAGLRYVALSHVWSGGLGNVNANSMFSCQLRILQRLLLRVRDNSDDDLDRDRGSKKTAGMKRDIRASFRLKPLPRQPVLLWIDTLCVPVGSENVQARQMAIAQMAQIYVEAQCVLVVDPELQKMECKDLPDVELFANVLCSAWNSRSWTFQEACMARVFYVQFLDGYSVVDQKWHNFRKHLDRETTSDLATSYTGRAVVNVHQQLMLEVSDWFATMPVMTKIRSYDARTLMTKSEDWQNFIRVWNGLRTRSTTKSDDLYGIIAIMVDLTAYEILKLDPRERMKAILRSQSTLPLSLLYQDCARFHDAEGRPIWAPCEIGTGPLHPSSGYMRLSDAGLLINMHEQGAARHTWPQVYRFSTRQPLQGSSNIRLADGARRLCARLCLPSGANARSLTNTWLVLVNETPRHEQITKVVRGALLSLSGAEGSTLLTDYICPIEITIAASIHSIEEDEKSCENDSHGILNAQYNIMVQTTQPDIEKAV
ncbi:MAG: hypothetical protein Q9182_004008 [Xanthomendoza sp. 2 TL-2023]